jgi:hypothetical protein
MVAAYLVSLVAWLDTRGMISLIPPFLVGSSVEAPVARVILAMDLPGWFIVSMFSRGGQGTRITDILIPLVSGAFWGLLVILVAKLMRLLLRYARPPAS